MRDRAGKARDGGVCSERHRRDYLLRCNRDQAEIAYEQGLDASRQQARDLMTCFHEPEASHKRLFDMTLSKRALEFVERDYRNMLQPLDVFDPMVPHGAYLAGDDPALLADYYDDLLYYRTALNILSIMYRRQLDLAESLAGVIESR